MAVLLLFFNVDIMIHNTANGKALHIKYSSTTLSTLQKYPFPSNIVLVSHTLLSSKSPLQGK